MEVIIELTKAIKGYDDEIDLQSIEDYIETVLNEEYKCDKNVYIALLLTDNENIHVINRDYRGKDSPTDVISFAYLESDGDIGPYNTLGDIVISLEKVEEQAKNYNHSFRREFFYVLTHGILHLLGYDHIDESEQSEMRKKEEEILLKHGYARD